VAGLNNLPGHLLPQGDGKAAASGEGKFMVGARLDKLRGDAIWLIHWFSTIVLTITLRELKVS
jgi:hypothetical protein